MFLIPAITMRSIAEEMQNGTLELLITKPISEVEIVIGKFLACLLLVWIALLPSLIYYYSVYQLASPVGNLDNGAIYGSYLGLLLLSASFVAIGIFSSSLTKIKSLHFYLE